MNSRTSATATLLLLVVLTAACGGHPSSSSRTSTRTSDSTTGSKVTSVPEVDPAATPKGWDPVDFGEAQISVPPSWVISLDPCFFLQPAGTAYLRLANSPSYNCPPKSQDEVDLLPLPVPAPNTRTELAHEIHGLDLYSASPDAPGDTAWLAPSLRVELILKGPLSTRVLDTITLSPRVVALAGPERSPPPVPSSWHRVSFGGISVAVPPSWPVETSSDWSFGCSPLDLTITTSSVVMNSGVESGTPACTGTPFHRIPLPKDGVVIDPGPYGPLPGDSGFGTCIHVSSVTACPTTSDIYGALVLELHTPSRIKPVAIDIGLAGDGVIAQTILDSIRAA
jgi:hypothetical protein